MERGFHSKRRMLRQKRLAKMVKNNYCVLKKLAFLIFVFIVGFSIVFVLGISTPKLLNSIYYELPEGFPTRTIVTENTVSYLTEEGLAYPLSDGKYPLITTGNNKIDLTDFDKKPMFAVWLIDQNGEFAVHDLNVDALPYLMVGRSYYDGAGKTVEHMHRFHTTNLSSRIDTALEQKMSRDYNNNAQTGFYYLNVKNGKGEVEELIVPPVEILTSDNHIGLPYNTDDEFFLAGMMYNYLNENIVEK